MGGDGRKNKTWQITNNLFLLCMWMCTIKKNKTLQITNNLFTLPYMWCVDNQEEEKKHKTLQRTFLFYLACDAYSTVSMTATETIRAPCMKSPGQPSQIHSCSLLNGDPIQKNTSCLTRRDWWIIFSTVETGPFLQPSARGAAAVLLYCSACRKQLSRCPWQIILTIHVLFFLLVVDVLFISVMALTTQLLLGVCFLRMIASFLLLLYVAWTDEMHGISQDEWTLHESYLKKTQGTSLLRGSYILYYLPTTR